MAHILVIEDDDHIRDEVVDWLQFEDHEVRSAPNGRVGLEMAKEQPPDLIVCDISMPEMNGHEVLMEVRASPVLNHVPFIFLTASADRDSMRRGMEMGADDYITKPFTNAELLKALNSRMERKTAQNSQTQAHIELLNSALTEERERSLLKSRLVAMFSHDFRNPLESILLTSGMLRSEGEHITPERGKKYLDRIDGSVHTLTQMLNDMMIVAEIEGQYLKYTPQQTNLVSLAKGIIDEFQLIDRGVHRLNFRTTLSETVESDPKLVRQILTNLISNAIKYSPSGTDIHIVLVQQDDKILLSVDDRGMGIPQESLPKLFEPFHRGTNVKHIKGTGLGLSIIKECVACFQGTVRVETEVGRGTKFIVEMPFHTS